MEKTATTPQFRNNGHGVKIKVCCASCSHMATEERLLRNRGDESSARRFCTLRGEVRKNNDGCPEWQMRKSLAFVPKGDGTVKDKACLTDWMNKTIAFRRRMDKAHKEGDYLSESRLRDEYEEYKKNCKQQST